MAEHKSVHSAVGSVLKIEIQRNRALYFLYHVSHDIHNPSFTLKAVKCCCEAEAGKARQSCNTSGNVDPVDFYEQTCEVSLWMKAGGAQP